MQRADHEARAVVQRSRAPLLGLDELAHRPWQPRAFTENA